MFINFLIYDEISIREDESRVPIGENSELLSIRLRKDDLFRRERTCLSTMRKTLDYKFLHAARIRKIKEGETLMFNGNPFIARSYRSDGNWAPGDVKDR